MAIFLIKLCVGNKISRQGQEMVFRSWYKACQSKPMALPVQAPPEVKPNYGFHRIDDLMDQETAEQLRQKFPDISYLGSGAVGLAYECSPGRACKITEDWKEARAAEGAISLQETNEYTGMVPVYSVERIQANPPLWLITAKKVTPLDQTDQKYYNFAPTTYVPTPNELADLLADTKQYYDNFNPEPGRFQLIIEKKRHLYIALLGNNISTYDAHCNNVGWDGENLVLLDLG